MEGNESQELARCHSILEGYIFPLKNTIKSLEEECKNTRDEIKIKNVQRKQIYEKMLSIISGTPKPNLKTSKILVAECAKFKYTVMADGKKDSGSKDTLNHSKNSSSTPVPLKNGISRTNHAKTPFNNLQSTPSTSKALPLQTTHSNCPSSTPSSSQVSKSSALSSQERSYALSSKSSSQSRTSAIVNNSLVNPAQNMSSVLPIQEQSYVLNLENSSQSPKFDPQTSSPISKVSNRIHSISSESHKSTSIPSTLPISTPASKSSIIFKSSALPQQKQRNIFDLQHSSQSPTVVPQSSAKENMKDRSTHDNQLLNGHPVSSAPSFCQPTVVPSKEAPLAMPEAKNVCQKSSAAPNQTPNADVALPKQTNTVLGNLSNSTKDPVSDNLMRPNKLSKTRKSSSNSGVTKPGCFLSSPKIRICLQNTVLATLSEYWLFNDMTYKYIMNLQEESEIKTCPQCQYNCRATMAKFCNHLQMHNVFICVVCAKKYKELDAFIRHMRKHTLDDLYFCNKCEFYSNSKSQAKSHEMKHKEKITFLGPDSSEILPYGYICNKCGVLKLFKSYFTNHLERDKCSGQMIKILITAFSRTEDEVIKLRSKIVGFNDSMESCDMGGRSVLLVKQDTPCECVKRKSEGVFINILPAPSNSFFEPRSFKCYTCSDFKTTSRLEITLHLYGHASLQADKCQVCEHKIKLADMLANKGYIANYFTYPKNEHLESEINKLVFDLSSVPSAPKTYAKSTVKALDQQVTHEISNALKDRLSSDASAANPSEEVPNEISLPEASPTPTKVFSGSKKKPCKCIRTNVKSSYISIILKPPFLTDIPSDLNCNICFITFNSLLDLVKHIYKHIQYPAAVDCASCEERKTTTNSENELVTYVAYPPNRYIDAEVLSVIYDLVTTQRRLGSGSGKLIKTKKRKNSSDHHSSPVPSKIQKSNDNLSAEHMERPSTSSALGQDVDTVKPVPLATSATKTKYFARKSTAKMRALTQKPITSFFKNSPPKYSYARKTMIKKYDRNSIPDALPPAEIDLKKLKLYDPSLKVYLNVHQLMTCTDFFKRKPVIRLRRRSLNIRE